MRCRASNTLITLSIRLACLAPGPGGGRVEGMFLLCQAH